MKQPIDDGGPAFPGGLDQNAEYHRQFCEPMNRGMTMRQWYAGLAMQGFLADGGQRLVAQAIEESPDANLLQDSLAKAAAVNEQIAFYSVRMADSLIAALKEKNDPHT